MPFQKIQINEENIENAAEKILDIMDDSRNGNVLYFQGWNGRLGASAVLKVVTQYLKSSVWKFDKVIHVDCLVWRSRRDLQKVVAEELGLPQSVMAIFDRHDQDDDFKGVGEGSRRELQEVWGHIFRSLANSTFVVIFHNGSDRYIDLSEIGIPVYPHNLSNKILWTFHLRFQKFVGNLDSHEISEFVGNTTSVMYGRIGFEDKSLGSSTMWGIMHEDAKVVAECIGKPEYINPWTVVECIRYMWLLQQMDIDWETHASNYWLCDGIVQGDTSVWEICDAMKSYIPLNWIFPHRWMCEVSLPATHHLQRQIPISLSSSPWIKTDSWNSNVPPQTTSLFVADKILPPGMFQHPCSSISLRVLHVSSCTLSFACPPFLCCSNLRFLLLDHCQDNSYHRNDVHDEHRSHSQSESWRACFRRLWVLDLSYTDWYQLLSEEMMSLMADLRELNVKGVKKKGKYWSITDFRGSGTSLTKLRITDFSTWNDRTNNQAPFPDMSSANNLKAIILDGCAGLENIACSVLPPSLESFSFVDSWKLSASKMCSISFRGCSHLKSIVLIGFFGRLEELDLSGTAVKTLDLREVEARNLKRIILLGCEKLCSILWPPENKRKAYWQVVHISSIRSASPSQANYEEKPKVASSASRSSSILNVAGSTQLGISQAASLDFNWHISARDARLLRSLEPLGEYISQNIHMEMDSPPSSRVIVGDSEVAQGFRRLQQPDHCLYARDVFFQGKLQTCAGSEGVSRWMWACPPSPTPRTQQRYVHISHESSNEGTSASAVVPPRLISDSIFMLHVHDTSYISCIPLPQDSTWGSLQWCRVERCPELDSVFYTTEQSFDSYKYICCGLKTFWVSQLPKARYIWNGSAISVPRKHSFGDLVFLHLDYCPRLMHVLPLSEHMTGLSCLETLEILCCGELREVFPLDPKHHEPQKTMEFPNLRRVHLYDVPMLRRICGSRMSAPNLDSVKIRGCWGLRRLPAVGGNTTKRPKVDCEKDWWDNLEWDGVATSHHPMLYEPSHSLYYKKAHMPRGTVLSTCR